MISLKSLTLRNFLSHKETAITFSSGDKILLDGNSGAGKSSIVDAIIWALYGEGRAENKSLVLKGEETAEVRLRLYDDTVGSEIEIRRATTAKGKHTLSVFTYDFHGREEASALTGIKEIQAWIEKDLIGASYLLFVNSVVHTQDGAELFVTQPASKRKELLLEIVKADDFTTYYEKAREKASELASEKAALEASIKEKSSFLEKTREQVSSIPTVREEIKTIKSSISEANKELSSLEEKATSMRDTVAKRDSLSFELRGAIANKQAHDLKISNAESAKQKLETMEDVDKKLAALDADEVLLIDASTKGRALLSEVQSKQASWDAYMKLKPSNDESPINKREEIIKKAIEDLDSGEVCPLGDSCPYQGKKNHRLLELVSQLGEVTSQRDSQRKAYSEWEAGLAPVGGAERPDSGSLTEQVALLDTKMRKLSDDRLAAARVKADFDTYKAIADELPGFLGERLVVDAIVSDLERQIKEVNETLKGEDPLTISKAIEGKRSQVLSLSSQLGAKESMLEVLNGYEKSIATEEKAIKEITDVGIKGVDAKIEKVKLIKDAFGNNGIRSIVIDYMLPRLEDSINDILSRLSSFQVRLDTQSEKATGDGVKEGLFITILNDLGEELPYESYSGGEKLKITVAISEALAGLQKVNFRVFDETVLALDEDSLSCFVAIVERLLVNTDQIIGISHVEDVKNIFPRKIRCVKNNGVTTINNE